MNKYIPKQGKCYAVFAGPFVKVGYTTNLEGRLQTMMSGCPFFISDVRFVECRTGAEAREYEAALHAELKCFHANREWFWVTVESIDIISRRLPKKMGRKIFQSKAAKVASSDICRADAA